MENVLLFGVVASSPLVIGSALGAYFDPPDRLTANLLAFASGALVIELAYDLFERAFSTGGPVTAGAGLLAGAATFTVIDYLIDRRYGEDSSGSVCWQASRSTGSPRTRRWGSSSSEARTRSRCWRLSSPRTFRRRWGAAGASRPARRSPRGTRSASGPSPPSSSRSRSWSGTPCSPARVRRRWRWCGRSPAARSSPRSRPRSCRRRTRRAATPWGSRPPRLRRRVSHRVKCAADPAADPTRPPAATDGREARRREKEGDPSGSGASPEAAATVVDRT